MVNLTEHDALRLLAAVRCQTASCELSTYPECMFVIDQTNAAIRGIQSTDAHGDVFAAEHERLTLERARAVSKALEFEAQQRQGVVSKPTSVLAAEHKMTIVHAGDLRQRLLDLRVDPSLLIEGKHDTSINHLIWMCDTVIASLSVNGFSLTKANRWIGYIQGIMVARGFTTVQFERTHYKSLKANVLGEMSK